MHNREFYGSTLHAYQYGPSKVYNFPPPPQAIPYTSFLPVSGVLPLPYQYQSPQMDQQAASSYQPVSSSLHIGNIHQSVTPEELKSVFSRFGRVVDARVLGDPYQPVRYAFVGFERPEEADAAMTLNGMLHKGYPLKITKARPQMTSTAPGSQFPGMGMGQQMSYMSMLPAMTYPTAVTKAKLDEIRTNVMARFSELQGMR